MFEIVLADLKNPRDCDAIMALLRHYALDPMGGGEPLSDYAQKNLIAELKKRSDVFILLAFEGDQPVGLINCFEGFSTFQARPLMNIHDLVVYEKSRGRGLAGLMLAQLEKLARQRRCCKLTLEVLQANHGAKAAYRKAGFAPYQLDPEMGEALFWEKKLQ